MIYIYDKKNNTHISLEGEIKEDINKRGYTEIMSTRGLCFQEHTRSVIDVNIDIRYLSNEDYNKLKLLFMTSKSSLFLEDDDTGSIYSDYIFKGSSLSLSKEQDYDNKVYYYKGTLSLMKK